MLTLLVAVLVLDNHAVDLWLFWVLGYKDAFKVLGVLLLFGKERFFDLLDECCILGLTNDRKSFLGIIGQHQFMWTLSSLVTAVVSSDLNF